MYQQRAEAAPGAGRGWWRPALEPEDTAFEPAGGDAYVVLDDVEGGRAVVVICRWPQVDDAGHLLFPDEAVTRDLDAAELQAVVDRERERAGQPAPERPLRVGDVFWVRADGGAEASAPQEWTILDVTRPARRAARAALLLAANPALRAPAGDPPPAAGDEPLEPPPTGTASPAV